MKQCYLADGGPAIRDVYLANKWVSIGGPPSGKGRKLISRKLKSKYDGDVVLKAQESSLKAIEWMNAKLEFFQKNEGQAVQYVDFTVIKSLDVYPLSFPVLGERLPLSNIVDRLQLSDTGGLVQISSINFTKTSKVSRFPSHRRPRDNKTLHLLFKGTGIQAPASTLELPSRIPLLHVVDIEEAYSERRNLVTYSKRLELTKVGESRLSSAVKEWGAYEKGFLMGKLQSDTNLTLAIPRGNLRDLPTSAADLTELLRTRDDKKMFEIGLPETGEVTTTFRYFGISVDSDILADIIMNESVIASTIFVQDGTKTVHFSDVSGQHVGNLVVRAFIDGVWIRASVQQEVGKLKERNKPYINVRAEGQSVTSVRKFARFLVFC